MSRFNLQQPIIKRLAYIPSFTLGWDLLRHKILIGGNASVVSPGSSLGGTHIVSRRNHCGEFPLRAGAGVDVGWFDFVRIQMATH